MRVDKELIVPSAAASLLVVTVLLGWMGLSSVADGTSAMGAILVIVSAFRLNGANDTQPGAADRRPARRTTPSVPIFFPDWLVVSPLARATTRAITRYGKGVMVDVGCGDAPFAATAQQHCDRYIATDVVAGPIVDVVSSIDSLPFDGESIDTVLCLQVLEHVGSPADAIAELSRILRPGGILIASMPQYSPNHEEPFDFGRFTIHGIRRLAESNGLAIVEHHRVGGSFSVVGLASNYAICELVQRTVPVRWKRVATGLFIPLFLVTNITGYLLDALIPLRSDSVNHLVVAAKGKASTLRSETSNAVP